MAFLWTTLVLAIFWPLPVVFRKKRQNSLDSALNLTKKKRYFFRLNKLVAAAQTNTAKLSALFQKFKKAVCTLSVKVTFLWLDKKVV